MEAKEIPYVQREGVKKRGVKERCMHFFLPTMRYKRKTK